MRFKITVEYDGTDYQGWQIQPNGRTIQGELEAAIIQLVGESARVAAAGRTDAGVHASGQVASFTLEQPRPTEVLLRGLNALTPRNIAITAIEAVDDGFDPRRAASSRTYTYRIWNAEFTSPFWRRYTWHVSRPLQLERLQAAAADLLGEHDFTSFQAAGCDAEHAIRRVLRSEMECSGPLLIYCIEATAYLRHMVRNIVGTLVEIGSGERPVNEMRQLLAARDRRCAGPTAPATGLCLTRVQYDRKKPRVEKLKAKRCSV